MARKNRAGHMLDLAVPPGKGRWGESPARADFQDIVNALLELNGEAATLAWLKGTVRLACGEGFFDDEDLGSRK